MIALAQTIRQVLDFTLFHVSDRSVTVESVLVAMAILGAAYLASRVAQRILARGARLGVRELDAGAVATAQRLTHYSIMLVGAGVAVETIGIDLTTLFTAGAVVAVGLGFAMQNILQNFVSGVILLIERSITPGDVLEVDGKVVRVDDMRIRSTVARTWDDEELIIPNSTLVQSTVKNFTLHDQLYRIRARVGVAYDTDVEYARDVLLAAARALEGRSLAKEPKVHLWEFADSSIVFEVSVWIENPWDARATRSDVNFAIRRALNDAGITIAFPQLDLHLDPEVVERLGGARAARGRMKDGA
ncbi:MAG: hypothetical protein D6701_05380 [Gemmatimonadetes bacterium]|nr:MAG: hypothetical protein D6701_05380 [Gemmatimonadota bacterium]